MKRFFYLFTFTIILCSLLTNCYTVKLFAPANKDITLSTENENLPIKVQKMNWYILFGSVNLSRNKTDKIIEEKKFTKVRVTTKMTFGNFLVNFLLNALFPPSVVTNTTIVEGTTAK